VTPADRRRLGPVYEANRLALQWDYAATVARLGLSEEDRERLARLLEVTYRADVEILDGIVGRALETLRASGLDADTLFAFTADHGEYLFHPERLFQWGHGLQLAPEELAVPWILRPARGAFAPDRYAGVTRSIDVFPTLAGLCGVPVPPGVAGADLSPALLGRAPPPELLAFSHTKVLDERLVREFADLGLVRGLFPGTDPGLMWVSLRERDRFVRLRNAGDGSFACQAFDLAQDPLALRALPASAEEERRLAHYKRRLVEAYRSERGVDAETIDEDLRALGYVR
jgi:arylsulfatase A-like enzyme